MEAIYGENDIRSYELYHHGILGQKWGHQNGPPYPLDASDHSASEKKAGWRKSLEANVETNRRIRRATTAARQEKKIQKLELKTPTERRQEKIAKLKAARDTKIADLSQNEVELGRRYMEQQDTINRISLAGMVVAGTPGYIAASIGAQALMNTSQRGKETLALRRQVNAENYNRLNNDDN